MSVAPDPAVLLELAFRATLLLGGAVLIDRLLRGAAAATRHGLWAATTLALLALPMLHAHLPRLPIPGWTAESSLPPARVDVALSSGDKLPAIPGPAVHLTARAPEPLAPAPVQLSWGQRLTALWAVVMLAIAASIGRGVVRARRVLRGATTVTSPRLLARLDHARRLIGVRQPVRLAAAEEVRTPMTGGLRRPTILVPSDAVGWPDDLLDTVLRHELIHIRRRDALHQLLSRCSVALYWCHPLSWHAAHLAARAREEACDEAVLALGTRPSHYARHLVALAGGGTVAPLLPALARLHHPTLEDRVITILSPRAALAAPRRTVFALATLLGWTTLVAAAGPASAQRPPEPPAPAEAPRAPAPPTARLLAVAGAPSAPTAPAAPAPPAAPAAPAPPAASDCELGTAGRVSARGSARDRGPVRTIQRDLGDRAICMAVRGPLPEGTSLHPMPPLPEGVVITMAARGGDGVQRLVISGSRDGNRHEWSVNDRARPFDRDAMAWRDAMLEVRALSAAQGRARAADAAELAEVAVVRGERAAVAAADARVEARRIREVEVQRAAEARARAEVAATDARVDAQRIREVEVQRAAEVRARAEVAASDARVDAQRSRQVEQERAVRARAEVRGRNVAEVRMAQADRERELREVEAVARVAEQRQVERQRALREVEAADRAEIRARAAAVEADRRVAEARVRREASEVAARQRLVERRAVQGVGAQGREDVRTRLVPAEQRLAELIDRIGGR